MVRESAKALIAIAAGIVVGYGTHDHVARWHTGLRPMVTASPAGESGPALRQSPPAAAPGTGEQMRQVDPYGPALESRLLEIQQEVQAQAQLLERQARLLDELTGVQRSQAENSLAHCQSIQQRLEKQLEGCLFAKAKLERSLTAARETSEPRATITVQEHVERPKPPGTGETAAGEQSSGAD